MLMSLKDKGFRKAYSSDTDDILSEFYIPALEESVKYDRLAGFFSSTSLAAAAQGIIGLIKNGGRMRLIASPRLVEKDAEILSSSRAELRRLLEDRLLDELQKMESEFIEDHVMALAWMVANHALEMKVALLMDADGTPRVEASAGIFHEKVGLLYDSEGNCLSFSGSVNESALGWLQNIEEFKVFRGWKSSEAEYVEADSTKFRRLWEGYTRHVMVVDVPRAVREKLVSLAPERIDEETLVRHYRRSRRVRRVSLYQHQREAVDRWIDSDKKGILEMATGTGKTFTALACAERVAKEEEKLAIIIACPQQHLVQQWKREIDKFGLAYYKVIADGTKPSWKDELANTMMDLSLGYRDKVIVITTDRTFPSHAFRKIMEETCGGKLTIMLIGDEVHGLGAERAREGLLDMYIYRLGLSATPRRWFDPLGTDVIYDYFGGVVFEFSLKDATTEDNPSTGRTYLTPYRYVPHFVSLEPHELDEYIEATSKIVRTYWSAGKNTEREEILKLLLFRRADIIKNASAKYGALEHILDGLGSDIRWCIVYCAPQQMDKVMRILGRRELIAHRFTMDEGTRPEARFNGRSERDHILRKFAEGSYQVLSAMKCLDQGVDVPPARIAIFMASSGNPREYIQRIGRVLRRYPGKREALIHDVVVRPDLSYLPKELRSVEVDIFKREVRRYEEIAENAINNAEAIALLDEVKAGLRRFR